MTLLYADGFEDGTTPWTLTIMSVAAARNGNGLVASGAASKAIIGVAPTAGPLIVGCAFKPTSAASGIMQLQGALSVNVGIIRGSGGDVQVWRSSVAMLGSSAAGVLPAAAWSYVEVRTVIHDTTGSVEVRVNGVSVVNVTNVDTKQGGGTTIDEVLLGSTSAGSTAATVAWDDVYICDATGTVNNTFVGDIIVEHLRPVADDTAQWLGSDGNSTNNYDLVDEAGTYNGADYVASATVGQRDLYTVSPSSKAIATPVAGVVVAVIALKTDVGARGVKLDIKEGSGGTVRSSAELGLPTTFGEIRAVFDRKGDGSAWTVADVNALRVGYEVST